MQTSTPVALKMRFGSMLSAVRILQGLTRGLELSAVHKPSVLELINTLSGSTIDWRIAVRVRMMSRRNNTETRSVGSFGLEVRSQLVLTFYTNHGRAREQPQFTTSRRSPQFLELFGLGGRMIS